MKRFFNVKALVLSFLMVMSFALPMSAQRSDDFFKVDENQYDNRLEGVIWGTIVTQDPTQPAPLGSGLLVMVAAGAGYAVARRKRVIRKGTALLLTAALLLGMTQCKKNVETIKTVEGGIPMTLEAYNGSRTSFDGSGAISWGTNEVIYVVYNGSCIGSVTNGAGGGTTFTGTVTGLESGNQYTLHYYYVGTEKTIAANATSFSMDFVNQDGSLANLGRFHMGHGTQTLTYEGGSITSTAGLSSLVSIGYFDIAGMAEVGEKVYMYGDNLNNKISINFSTNAVTNTKVTGNNLICLGTVTSGATCGKYVMLVPNHTDGTETLTTNITFISKRTTGTCNSTFNYGIVADRFYCKGGNTSTPIDVEEAAYDEGTLRGEFTINGSGKKVKFAPGNLRATYSGNSEGGSWTWHFAEHQYDFIGNAGGNKMITTTTKEESEPYARLSGNGTVDLFGWSSEATYYGIAKSKQSSNPSPNDYTGAFVDWGGMDIDGKGANYWRTMSCDNDNNNMEWFYLMQRRSGTTINEVANARFTLAIINTDGTPVNGMILFPDNYLGPTTSTDDITFGDKINTQGKYDDWGGTSCTIAGWAVLESAGCVFLPACGERKGTDVDFSYNCYASKTNNGVWGWYPMKFNSSTSNWNIMWNGTFYRYTGASVRLVHGIN